MIRSFIALLFALFAAPAFAQSPQIQSVEIVEHGLYATDKTNCRRDDRGILLCDRSNTRLAVSTWTVPAQIGVEFGLKYRVNGAPAGAKVTIRRDWLLPKPGFQPPDKPQILRLDRQDDTAIGAEHLVTYGFDDAWELVPGPWVLELWDGDRLLASKTFTIAKSPGA